CPRIDCGIARNFKMRKGELHGSRRITDRYFKLSRQLEPRFLTEHVPMVWKAARGVTVWDVEGKEYLDCTSGIFVAAIGHSHPKYVKAVCSQVEQLLTCYDRLNEPRIKLA